MTLSDSFDDLSITDALSLATFDTNNDDKEENIIAARQRIQNSPGLEHVSIYEQRYEQLLNDRRNIENIITATSSSNRKMAKQL
ncbi:hypothetical protein BDA99DRAFT_558403 [Phascolomyces articulosus]|uniref:Uncharacterized protein n=1 Tax=Phascolomyces articulosus TaxID=60185 RepID=A0AAD5PFV7_9FUNG|nr:hypothetical protein BDA99DRAFT_558403 [Phascolomyces articulosus]